MKSDKFLKCLKDEFPSSILLTPCLPCFNNGKFKWLLLSSIATLIGFFILLFYYRNIPNMIYYLNNDYWIPYYFVMCHSLVITLTNIYLVNQTADKDESIGSIIGSSVGIGILLLISSLASLQFYQLTQYLPIGRIVLKILEIIERYLGQNVPKLLVGWWGITFSWLLILIPIIGPIIGGLLMMIPQHLILISIGYLTTCSIYSS